MRIDLPRLSFAPVTAELARQGRPLSHLADRCGVRNETVRAWSARGMKWQQADLAAAALNVHPNDLWGAEWWAIEEAHAAGVDRRRAARRDQSWAEVERSWWEWSLGRDRVEMHRELWPT